MNGQGWTRHSDFPGPCLGAIYEDHRQLDGEQLRMGQASCPSLHSHWGSPAGAGWAGAGVSEGPAAACGRKGGGGRLLMFRLADSHPLIPEAGGSIVPAVFTSV